MPKYDYCHRQVVNALRKDGWFVASKSLFLTDAYRNDAYIDIDATRGTNGTITQHIYVEVKCFDRPKETAGFHRAIGQYIMYRGILNRVGLLSPLYLAVPSRSFSTYFNQPVLDVIAQHELKLLVVDIEQEKVLQWIES